MHHLLKAHQCLEAMDVPLIHFQNFSTLLMNF